MGDVAELVARAEAAGLRLCPRGETLRIRGPLNAKPLVEQLRLHKSEALALLALDHCSRCGGRSKGVVATYWTNWRESLCPACVADVVEDFDRTDTWPRFRVPDRLLPPGETP